MKSKLILLGVILMTILIGCSSQKLSEDATIEEKIISVLGTKAIVVDSSYDKVTVTRNDTGMSVIIVADEEKSNYIILRNLIQDIITVGQIVYEDDIPPDELSIAGGYVFLDRFGNKELDLAIFVKLSNKTASKINWENMYPENFFLVADTYHLQHFESEFLSITGLTCTEYCFNPLNKED